jgi:uncharacterized protein (DUF697 family)
MLYKHGIPIIAVITKAKHDNGFQNTVQKLMPNTINVVRVRAIEERYDIEGQEPVINKPMGLKELVTITFDVIPEGKKRAFAAAQKIRIDLKKEQSHKIVAGAATLAAGIGAVPIPFSDAAGLIPIQIGMLVGISATFGLPLEKNKIATLFSSVVGIGSATIIGRTIVGNLLKFVPGGGSIVGGMISGGVAAAVTTTLGEAYIFVLANAFEKDPYAENMDIGDIIAQLKKKLNRK